MKKRSCLYFNYVGLLVPLLAVIVNQVLLTNYCSLMADSDSGHEGQASDSEVNGFRGFDEGDEESDDSSVIVSLMNANSNDVDSINDLEEAITADNTNSHVFDDDLPLEHSYLGSNLEILSGRVILSEGARVCIPLLPHFYGTLIPGQTLPLTIRESVSLAMLKWCVANNHTFGCVARSNRNGVVVPQHGTTVEIYEFADNFEYINVKAKARQRFKLLKTKRADAGYLLGFVEILPEVLLNNPLCIIQSLGRYRKSRRQWCRRTEALMTAWPSWVYDMYDGDTLVKRVHKDLSFLNQGLKKESGKGEMMPHDVTQLSFWIGAHFDVERRMFLITLNSPIQRLRWQLSTMTKHQEYVCGSCESQIGTQCEVFAMSTEGAQSTYVNPLGMMHDTLTFRKVKNVSLITQPSTEYSWFPGYAWSVGICSTCKKHLGWRFSAVSKKTVPKNFYGLTRSALQVKILLSGLESVI